MNDIFSYLKNSSVDVLPDRGLSKQWHELNMNRNTLGAFQRVREQQEELDVQDSKDSKQPSYLEKYIEGSTEKISSAENTDNAPKTGIAEKTEKAANDKTQEAISDKNSKEAVKDKEKEESYLQKFLRASTEKLSKPNKELSSYSTQMSDSVKRLETIIDKLGGGETQDEDGEDIFNAADDLVGSFNSLTRSLRESGNNTVSSKYRFIDDMTNAYGSRLERVGINKNDDGTLSVDKDKLSQASPRDIEKAFGKKDSFASFIDEQAKQLASYAQTDVYQRASAYTNAGNITNVSNINGSFMSMLG